MKKRLNKRADVKLGYIILITVGFAVVTVALYFTVLPNLLKIISSSPSKARCSNTDEWINVEKILKKFDAGESVKLETPFYNNNCNLVSFTFSQNPATFKISSGGINLGIEPMLCLCNVVSDSCIPDNCYVLKNFDSINGQQFETSSFKPYTILKFTKNERNLIIDFVGDKKEAEKKEYLFSDEYRVLDPKLLVRKLSITFSTPEISSFLPIVDVKDEQQFTPEGVPNVPGFNLFFDLKLTEVIKDLPLSALRENPKLISSGIVKSADIELNVAKDKFSKVPEDLKNSIKLYYLRDGKWEFSRLNCEEQENNNVCSGSLLGFGDSFVVSAKALPILSNALSQAELNSLLDGRDPKKLSESEVKELITVIAERAGVPPGLAIAVAMQEHHLDHYENGKVVFGDKGNSVGMFQIHRTNWGSYDCDVKELTCNIAVGMDILKKCYKQYGINNVPYLYNCKNIYYSGWDAALRCYNGWPKGCSGTPNYVEEVNQKYNLISANYKARDKDYGIV